MPPETRTAPPSKAALRGGLVLTGLSALFLIFDGVAKVLMVAPVREACAQLEIPERVVPGLGGLLVVITLIYAIRRISVLGAILLTGYLGGATWTHVRMGGPVFPMLFPSLMGALIWGGLLLREPRLRDLFPVRRPQATVKAEGIPGEADPAGTTGRA